jgi:hypothetical protein
MIKATNEASLVSYWVFYTRPEIKAIQWIDKSAENSSIWTGFSGRLQYAQQLVQGASSLNNHFVSQDESGMPNFLISDWVRQESAIVQMPLPDTDGYLEVYDNGMAQLFHRRPATPYQH